MIRRAKISDSKPLTSLSFKSKSYWNYPDEFFEVWAIELTITADYIQKNDVFLYEVESEIAGYYSIVELKEDLNLACVRIEKGFWLEHMFIEPKAIGQGIGTQLFQHLQKRCHQLSMTELGILADPNAKGFYEKMGCVYMGEYPSTIEGRTTPHLMLKL